MPRRVKTLPTQAYLKEHFEYDKNTGILSRWKNGKLVPRTAVNSKGYREQISIEGKRYQYHRLVWVWYYGDEDIRHKDLDHINGDPTDNRISNLRLVTQSENLRNAKISKNNKLGHANISFQTKRKKCPNGKVYEYEVYVVYVQIPETGKQIYRHRKTLEEALLVRDELYQKFNYYKNHGRTG